MPQFSVIVPTYGRAEMLQEAVDSVLAQDGFDIEVIVVDDASATPATVLPNPRVRLIRASENLGPGGARNLGVASAEGEYLSFLDDDDLWLPNRLEAVAGHLELGTVAVCWQSSTGRILSGNVHGSILDRMTPHLGSVTIHRDDWVPFDSTYRSCQDLVWWLDVTAVARVKTIPVRCVDVRKHSGARPGYGGASRIANSKRMLRERSEYFTNHPRAAAFRWRRIGLMSIAIGRPSDARRAFLTALKLRPSLRDLKHLLWTARRGSARTEHVA